MREIVKKLSSDLIHLDHLLRTYGPEANEARANLRAYTTSKNDELFPVSNVPAPTDRETSDRLDRLLDAVLSLAPPTAGTRRWSSRRSPSRPASTPSDGCYGKIPAPRFPRNSSSC